MLAFIEKYTSMFLHPPQQRNHLLFQLTSTILPFTFTSIIQDCSVWSKIANYVKHCSACKLSSGIQPSIINNVTPMQQEVSKNRVPCVKSTRLWHQCLQIHEAISEDAQDYKWWLNCIVLRVPMWIHACQNRLLPEAVVQREESPALRLLGFCC